MAVIEISKIQVRRGQENQTGVPPLDGGEFAWAADTEQLYIGLRRQDGGARDANIRVLTENDLRNFFTVTSEPSTSSYTYRYLTNPPITSFYTATTATAVVRTVNDRLDDFVSIKNFLTQDNWNSTVTTEIIQLAVNRLFLTNASSAYAITTGTTPAAKVLYFPAGRYNINSTIFLPANATIIGEGIDKTIINRTTTGTSNGGCIFQTIDKLSNPEADDVSDLLFTHFDNTPTAFTKAASNVLIQGMTLKFDSTTGVTGTNGIVSLDCADHAVIRDVKFQGNMFSTSSNAGYVGVNLRGYSSITTNHVSIENCEVINLYAGVKSNYDVNNIVIRDCYMTQCERGIEFNNPAHASATTGPNNILIDNNKFFKINRQAIFAGTSTSTLISSIISKNNSFVNVGNIIPSIGETYSTGTAVITFGSKGNASVNDYFNRQDYQDSLTTGTVVYNDLVEGRAVLNNDYMKSKVIPTDTTATIMRLPITGFPNGVNIKYTTISNTGSNYVDRVGEVLFDITPSQTNVNDPIVKITDNFTYAISDGAYYWGAVTYEEYSMVEIILINPSVASGGKGQLEIAYQTKIVL